jgi:DNA-binding NtrC family response regulator
VAALVVLVHADPDILQRAEALLYDAGYAVVSASSFQAARMALDCVEPDVLIADVRLDDFNGLHLAILSSLERPRTRVIITHASADASLEREAERCKAVFVVNPLANPDFLPAVRSALLKAVPPPAAVEAPQ